ncbi:3-hydroxyacyl-ACP dehydratase FabZ [Verrucomicrobiota bacterium]
MSTDDTNILDCDQLRTILPHRYPFLMVDRVMLVRSENRAVGIKNVTINEPFFQGHFPDNPVMPGILILETMVQTGGVIIREMTGTQTEFAFLKSISKAKFRKPVFPGDRLMINTELVRFRSGIAKLRATATVRDQQACQAEFTVGIRENIPEILRIPEFAPDLYMNGAPIESVPFADIHGVMNRIPHRYPFILVDSILSIDVPRIFGLKNVTANEPFFSGHFPKHAVMPGTLLVEAIAQVGGVYVLDRPQNKGKLGYFMAVDSARFRRPVRPGDQLLIEVETLNTRGRVGKARGRIFVGKHVVAEARITFVIVNRIAAP